MDIISNKSMKSLLDSLARAYSGKVNIDVAAEQSLIYIQMECGRLVLGVGEDINQAVDMFYRNI